MDNWDNDMFSSQMFLNMLNGCDPHIKFTINTSTIKLSFLDVEVSINDTKIETDIYHKSTDTKQYLHFNSCHPQHIKRNIPYNLARRICTIVSNSNIRTLRLEQLYEALKSRGYPETLIRNGITKAQSIDIKTLRTVITQKTDNNTLTFITTYNPNYNNVFKHIQDTLPILQESQKMNEILSNNNLICSRRQPPSLKKILTKAAFETTSDKPNTNLITKCNDKKCKCCPIIHTSNTFTIGSKTFSAGRPMTCQSVNLLYVLKCTGCDGFYIGETGDRLIDRMRVHRQQSKEGSAIELPVHKHFKRCSFKEESPFIVFPFFKLPPNCDKNFRLSMEKHFINIFKPNLNREDC
jgi:hypothetical protein